MKKLARTLISFAVLLAISISFCSSSFANNTLETSNSHKITNLQTGYYTDDNGAFVSWASYFEGGVAAS